MAARIRRLKWKHGISKDEATRLAAKTECEVCGAKEVDLGERLHVDHCHKTGRIRGVLCRRCNYAAAVFDDDPAWLEKLKAYVAAV
jgi:hypothetical protein